MEVKALSNFWAEEKKDFPKEIKCCWYRLILDPSVQSGARYCLRYSDPSTVSEN